MRILMTIHHPLEKSSGASGSMLQLAQEYRALGHQVETFSFDDLPARWPEILKMLLFPGAVALHLQRRMRRENFDVIDAHTGDSWVWSRLRRFSRRARRVLLITRSSGLEHAAHLERIEDNRSGKLRLSRHYFLYHGGFRLWEVAQSLRLSDGCIFLNAADRNYGCQALGVDFAKTLISGNGIPAAFAALPLATLDADPPRVAVVGTYSERKGIAYSVPALEELLEKHPALEVGFFGVMVAPERVLGDFSPAVRARIHVVETYSHDDLPALLQPYKFQLLASISEGFGKVLLEGMARGLACVSSDAPGPLEIARDGENALVVPRRDSAAIVAAMERLLGDDSLCQQLRRAAQETAQQHFWASIARARLEFYARIGSSRP